MTWQVWFLQLSGWPVFLAVIAAVAVFMIAASVVLTWIGNRSVIQSIGLAALAVLLLVLVLLVALSVLSRTNVRA